MSDVARNALAGKSTATLKEIFRNVSGLSKADSIVTLGRGEITSGGARFNLNRDGAAGYWEFLSFRPGYYMVITNTIYKDDIYLEIPGEGFLEFHFKLSGRLKIRNECGALTEIVGPKTLLWRQHESAQVSQTIFGGKREASVTTYCSDHFIEEAFGPIAATFPEDMKQLLFSGAEPVQQKILEMSPSLAVRVGGVINGAGGSSLRLLQAEAAGIELMYAALNQTIPRGSQATRDAIIKTKDAIKLHEAHDILIREFADPPTIPKLARRVGMNETKLKLGFKTLFSSTIAEFVRKCRMECACELMSQQSTPISHVAAAVGYEHQNSFTVAFKAHFGVLPKDYRKGNGVS